MSNEVAGERRSDRTGSEVAPAASYLKGYTSSNRTFIVELTEDSFKLIAQCLHILKVSEPDNGLLDLTLRELNNQTNCVMLKASDHKVYEKVLDSPMTAKLTKEVYYIPFDRGGFNR